MNAMDAHMLKQAFLSGAGELERSKEWINELNVFPVPDGDTGTNMTLTILAAARAVEDIPEPDMDSLAKAMSSGSLRGARGNSGVILSQLLRGFTKGIKGSRILDCVTLANAFERAAETAYKAVMKPKEGTILTVARAMAEHAMEIAPDCGDIEEFARRVLERGDSILAQTPDMLPVLKQAGVVDAGGQGLMQFLHGACAGLTGQRDALGRDSQAAVPGTAGQTAAQGKDGRTDGPSEADDRAGTERQVSSGAYTPEEILFGYCTEFIINLSSGYTGEERELEAEGELKDYLSSIGDSLVVVADEGIIKIHVHTNDPGLAIQKGLSYGPLSRMKIDNMREEHEERLFHFSQGGAAVEEKSTRVRENPRQEKTFGFVAVSAGAGLGEIFKGLGADEVIEGGQTMNPSTQDLLTAVQRTPASTVFILPNNKNIILAAEQVRYLAEDKEIVVIPSRTVPQGIAALVNFSESMSAEDNLRQMTREMERVKTGQMTYAVRDTVIDGFEIHEHNIMGLGDDGILAVGTSVETTALNTLKAMVGEDSELITIYYGCDVTSGEAGQFCEKAKKMFPSCELELHSGGQPVYYYLMSVE